MAVFAPMPRAITTTAASVKAGCLIRERAPYRRSCQSVSTITSQVGSGFRVKGSGFLVSSFWFCLCAHSRNRNHKPETTNQKPGTPNPEIQTRNPEYQEPCHMG